MRSRSPPVIGHKTYRTRHPRATDARDDAVSALGALLAPGPASADASAPDVALFGAHAAAGGEERTALGLPAYIRAPWDTIALVEYLQRARRHLDPVRANIVVNWRVREASPRTPRTAGRPAPTGSG